MGAERKSDHIEICMKDDVCARRNYWDDVKIIHRALPEISLDKIDTSVTLFGKKLAAPIIISAMTGGCDDAENINRNLAMGAAKAGVGLGVGSQRPALESQKLAKSYEVVKAFDVPLLIGNLGAPQMVSQKGRKTFTLEECKKAVEMIDADVLAIHMNFLQEVVQPEGETNAEGCLNAIGRIADKLPVIAKETGAGISQEVAQSLMQKGVIGLDVGGHGGTSFAAVEYHRAKKRGLEPLARLGQTFWDWGIPTPVSVIVADVGLPLISTGGLRNGLDVARSISLGASAGGLARDLLAAAIKGPQEVEKELKMLVTELKAAMFLAGASNVKELKDAPVVITGETADWLNAMEPVE
jgi:isopentenyl-diphosphate delta-isomerase